MATAADMKQLENMLRGHVSAMGYPVTEIVLFKLAKERDSETTAMIERDFVKPSSMGEGVRRVGWGYSLTAPDTFVIMFSWRKIEDHWAFWQTEAFNPVINCIATCFERGRPLVRHYKVVPPGMLSEEYVRLFVWDEGADRSADDIKDKVASKARNYKSSKAGFAVDMGETTWCSVLLGYDSEESAKSDEVTPQLETHLLKLQYIDGADTATA
ncbi:uncharacterized protein Z518_01801 [Rhinocladiella mackenziei CBS 650.93]|uniref:ABM domain-containing protein n=1 Tax=Rhinocladiella mackenziei CBS 650.93 TaxID=1442369 RepID=A0A0D2G6X1_9EURO|nr:uncharacterized protein Z518_01801 [Rhinocladiella mackenziei CBS 650.93]KIX10717.1 hypothetical protein Z518_01801 [Rhinocladiella mackenziei CBS 650.93]